MVYVRADMFFPGVYPPFGAYVCVCFWCASACGYAIGRFRAELFLLREESYIVERVVDMKYVKSRAKYCIYARRVTTRCGVCVFVVCACLSLMCVL